MGGEIGKIWYPYETCQPVLVIFKKIFRSERSPFGAITPCRIYGSHSLHSLPTVHFHFGKFQVISLHLILPKPTVMNTIDRAKNIIVSPNKEWDVIALEQPNAGQIITNYVLLLAGAAAVAAFIGYAFIGFNYGIFGRMATTQWGIYHALNVLVGAIAGVFISALVIDALAPTFGSEKNMGRSVQLVAYSYTPYWVAGLLAIYPPLALIGALAGLYGLYLMYIGMPKLKKTPPDKHAGYFIVSLVTIVVVYLIISLIMTNIVMSAMGLSYGYRGLGL